MKGFSANLWLKKSGKVKREIFPNQKKKKILDLSAKFGIAMKGVYFGIFGCFFIIIQTFN